MFTVAIDDDRVVLDLGGRRRDVMVSCSEADRLVEALRVAAARIEGRLATRVLTEVWDCKVESYDGVVALRFWGPKVGYPERVPMPPDAAKALADMVEFKAQQARYKMRFVFK